MTDDRNRNQMEKHYYYKMTKIKIKIKRNKYISKNKTLRISCIICGIEMMLLSDEI